MPQKKPPGRKAQTVPHTKASAHAAVETDSKPATFLTSPYREEAERYKDAMSVLIIAGNTPDALDFANEIHWAWTGRYMIPRGHAEYKDAPAKSTAPRKLIAASSWGGPVTFTCPKLPHMTWHKPCDPTHEDKVCMKCQGWTWVHMRSGYNKPVNIVFDLDNCTQEEKDIVVAQLIRCKELYHGAATPLHVIAITHNPDHPEREAFGAVEDMRPARARSSAPASVNKSSQEPSKEAIEDARRVATRQWEEKFDTSLQAWEYMNALCNRNGIKPPLTFKTIANKKIRRRDAIIAIVQKKFPKKTINDIHTPPLCIPTSTSIC